MNLEERLKSHFQEEGRIASGDRDSAKAWIQGRVQRGSTERHRALTVAFSLAVSAFVFVWVGGLLTSPSTPGQRSQPRDGGPPSVTLLQDIGSGGRTIAAGGGAVWAGTNDALTRIAPATNELDKIEEDGPSAATFAADSLWVAGLGGQATGMVARFEETGSRQALIDVGGGNVSALGGDEEAIWAVSSDDNGGDLSLLQIDPASNEVVNTLGLDSGLAEGADYRMVRGIATGGGKVWLLVADLRIDVQAEETVVLSTQLFSAAPDASHVDVNVDLPDATNLVYASGAVWASRGTSNGLRFDPSTDVVENLSTGLTGPFGDAQGRILFAHRGSNSEWQLEALDPTTQEVSSVATMPSAFSDAGTLVGGTWDATSSSAWLINESGDVLKIVP